MLKIIVALVVCIIFVSVSSQYSAGGSTFAADGPAISVGSKEGADALAGNFRDSGYATREAKTGKGFGVTPGHMEADPHDPKGPTPTSCTCVSNSCSSGCKNSGASCSQSSGCTPLSTTGSTTGASCGCVNFHCSLGCSSAGALCLISLACRSVSGLTTTSNGCSCVNGFCSSTCSNFGGTCKSAGDCSSSGCSCLKNHCSSACANAGQYCSAQGHCSLNTATVPATKPSATATTTLPVKETESVSSIPAGGTGNFSFEKMSITEIEVEVKDTVTNTQLTISKVDAASANISITAPGITYAYFNIQKINVTDANVNKVKIIFKVEKSWITNNNVNVSAITLNRYVNGTWVALTTTLVSSNGYYYFEAESPGLSIFAVSSEKGTVTTTTTTTIPESSSCECINFHCSSACGSLAGQYCAYSSHCFVIGQ